MRTTESMFFMSGYPKLMTAHRQSDIPSRRGSACALMAALILALWLGAYAPLRATANQGNTVTRCSGMSGPTPARSATRGSMRRHNSLHAHMVRPIARGDFKTVKADLTIAGAPRPDQYDWVYVVGGWYKEERYAYRDAQGNVMVGEFEYHRPLKRFVLKRDPANNPEAVD